MTEEELILRLREQARAAARAREAGGPAGYHEATMAAVNAAVAAYEYMSEQADLSGFQHGTGALLVAAKLRNVEGPLAIVAADNMLYPQYNLPSARVRLLENSPSWRGWLATKAEQLLVQHNRQAAPHVIEHWKRLVAAKPSDDEQDGDEE